MDYLRRAAPGRAKTLGKPNNAAVGPEKTLSRQNFERKVV
jgi:hypothetical protein